jgi:recombination protein RecA
MASDGKMQALEAALGQIEKQFGKGSIMRMGESGHLAVETIPTGSLVLDLALGSGVPRGRIVEIYGPESSGKTTLAIHIMREAQKRGGMAAIVDAEHAFDPEYARRIGVNIDELLISQPDTGEQALEIVETLVRSNALDVIVIDSVAALVPRAEIEGDMGDASVGVQARLMSQALRKLTGAISKSKTVVIFINQIRLKIGVMFGNPETTSGGQALKFYASVRMDIRRKEQIKVGDETVGIHVGVKIVKNKIAPPFKTAEFDIFYDAGISYEGDLLELGVKYDVLNKAGSWYQYKNDKIGQGKESARAYLKEHPEIAKQLADEITVAAAPKPREERPAAIGTGASKAAAADLPDAAEVIAE